MPTLFIKPAPNPDAPGGTLTILDANTLQPIPPEGKAVEASAYWYRRIRCGDVIEAVPNQNSSTEPVKEPADVH